MEIFNRLPNEAEWIIILHMGAKELEILLRSYEFRIRWSHRFIIVYNNYSYRYWKYKEFQRLDIEENTPSKNNYHLLEIDTVKSWWKSPNFEKRYRETTGILVFGKMQINEDYDSIFKGTMPNIKGLGHPEIDIVISCRCFEFSKMRDWKIGALKLNKVSLRTSAEFKPARLRELSMYNCKSELFDVICKSTLEELEILIIGSVGLEDVSPLPELTPVPLYNRVQFDGYVFEYLKVAKLHGLQYLKNCCFQSLIELELSFVPLFGQDKRVGSNLSNIIAPLLKKLTIVHINELVQFPDCSAIDMPNLDLVQFIGIDPKDSMIVDMMSSLKAPEVEIRGLESSAISVLQTSGIQRHTRDLIVDYIPEPDEIKFMSSLRKFRLLESLQMNTRALEKVPKLKAPHLKYLMIVSCALEEEEISEFRLNNWKHEFNELPVLYHNIETLVLDCLDSLPFKGQIKSGTFPKLQVLTIRQLFQGPVVDLLNIAWKMPKLKALKYSVDTSRDRGTHVSYGLVVNLPGAPGLEEVYIDDESTQDGCKSLQFKLSIRNAASLKLLRAEGVTCLTIDGQSSRLLTEIEIEPIKYPLTQLTAGGLFNLCQLRYQFPQLSGPSEVEKTGLINKYCIRDVHPFQ